MSSVVPPLAGLVTSNVPPSASMRSRSPVSPDSPGGVGAADPVVADRQPQGRVGCIEFDVHGGGARVLGGVGQRLRYRVVRRDLHMIRQPSSGAQVQLDWHGGPAGQRFERWCQAPLGQDRGVDAVGDLPHLVKHAFPPGSAMRASLPSSSASPGGTVARTARTSACTVRTSSTSETSCCWVPSCRSRSIRRRDSSAAATIRAREAISSARALRSRSPSRPAR